MTLIAFKKQLPEFATDTVKNIESLLNEQAVDDLSAKQIAEIALASAYATKQSDLISAIQQYAQKFVNEAEIEGVKIATSIMAMTNIYYRFIHIVSESEFKKLPAKLSTDKMANHSMDKVDFELCALAVSAINNCQLCIDSHINSLKKHGASFLSMQTAIRIAAVVNAAAQCCLISSK